MFIDSSTIRSYLSENPQDCIDCRSTRPANVLRGIHRYLAFPDEIKDLRRAVEASDREFLPERVERWNDEEGLAVIERQHEVDARIRFQRPKCLRRRVSGPLRNRNDDAAELALRTVLLD